MACKSKNQQKITNFYFLSQKIISTLNMQIMPVLKVVTNNICHAIFELKSLSIFCDDNYLAENKNRFDFNFFFKTGKMLIKKN